MFSWLDFQRWCIMHLMGILTGHLRDFNRLSLVVFIWRIKVEVNKHSNFKWITLYKPQNHTCPVSPPATSKFGNHLESMLLMLDFLAIIIWTYQVRTYRIFILDFDVYLFLNMFLLIFYKYKNAPWSSSNDKQLLVICFPGEVKGHFSMVTTAEKLMICVP